MKDFGLVVIGAHFGVWLSKKISDYKNSKILLVEPVPYNYKILQNEFRENKNILTYYKIHHKDYEKYLGAITKIENIRKGNNINWMNILRVAFTNSPVEASKIFKKIYSDDKTINFLSKKLF